MDTQQLLDYIDSFDREENQLTRYAIANRIIALLETDPNVDGDSDHAAQLLDMIGFANEYWDGHA